MYWEETPAEAELASFYAGGYTDPHEQQTIQMGGQSHYRNHVRLLATVSGKPAADIALLDFGSSYPVLVQEATRAGMRAVAVDESADAHAWARRMGVSCLKSNQIDEVPDESVDVLRLSHVLEHLIDPKSVLTGLLKKVKVGGLVYITQPNFPVLKAEHCEVELKDAVWPTHLHFFSVASLLRLAEQSGLSIFRFDTHPLPSPAERERLKAALDPECPRLLLALKAVRTRSFGERGFPRYLGENSECWARKRDLVRLGQRFPSGGGGFGREQLRRIATSIANFRSRLKWMLWGE